MFFFYFFFFIESFIKHTTRHNTTILQHELNKEYNIVKEKKIAIIKNN